MGLPMCVLDTLVKTQHVKEKGKDGKGKKRKEETKEGKGK